MSGIMVAPTRRSIYLTDELSAIRASPVNQADGQSNHAELQQVINALEDQPRRQGGDMLFASLGKHGDARHQDANE